jgi:hypothetical protein
VGIGARHRLWSADGYLILPGLIEPEVLDRLWARSVLAVSPKFKKRGIRFEVPATTRIATIIGDNRTV